MSFISDAISKMMGAGTAAEYRLVALDEFCNSNDLSNLSIEQEYKIDPSRRTSRFKRQVLFCRANQQTQNVALVISYDEDTGYTEGALIPLRDLTKHRTLASEYKSGRTYASSFFSYVVNELGVVQAVGARERSASVAPPDPVEVSKPQGGDETTIMLCPSCGGKNRVPAEGLESRVGRLKCGHCSFKWSLHAESSSLVIAERVGEPEIRSITYKMVTIDYSGSTYRVKDKTFNSLSAAKQFVDTCRSNNSKKNDQVTARDDLSPKTSGVPITEIDTAYADRLEGESPTSVVYQLHLIHRHDFGFKVEDEHFETVEEAIRWIDGKTLRARKIVDQDRARIIEKVMDLSVRKDRRPLVEDTLIAELKELGYLIFSLPNGKFRLEFRANKVPAGDSITDLRAVLETHGWRDKNYKS